MKALIAGNRSILKHLLLGLAIIIFSVRSQAQKLEYFTSSTGTYHYTATKLNDNSDTDYRKYIISDPHSGIVVVDSGNGNYNCHAFAWPNDTTVWVQPNYHDTSAPPVYYNDTTLYYKTTVASDAEIAVYGLDPTHNPIHSALRLTNSSSSNAFARVFLSKYPQYTGWYISKWDGGPLVIHQVDSCPFYSDQPGHPVTFYKKTSESAGSNAVVYSSSNYSVIGRQKLVCSSGSPFWLVSNAPGSDTIKVFPSGFTFTWTSSSNITLSPSSSAYPVTAAINGSGGDTGHISVTIHFPDGTSGSVGPYNVWVGPPAGITSISTSQWTPGGNGSVTITVSSSWAEFYAWPFNTADLVPPSPNTYDTHGAGSYTWTCSSGGGPAITFNQDPAVIGYRYAAGSFTPPNEYGIITVRASNLCGSTSDYQSIFESSSGDYTYTLSPNPASAQVTVNIIPSKQATLQTTATGQAVSAAQASAASSDAPVTYTVKVIDFSANVYYTSTKTANSFTIPVNNLKSGNYVVEVSDGKTISSKPLLIAR